MARNGSGTYVLPAGNPVAPGTVIESDWANTTMTDIGTALTGSLPRNGEAPMSAPLKLSDGTVAAPSLTFNSQTSTGVYWPGSGILAFTAAGVEVLRINSSGRLLLGSTSDTTEKLQVTGTAKITGNTTVGGTLGVTGAATLSSTLSVASAADNLIGTTNTGSQSSGLTVLHSGGRAISLTTNVTDTTSKAGRIGVRHYTNAEEDFNVIGGSAGSTTNVTQIGGGGGSLNAATDIKFYTAANNTTLTGTERGNFSSTGVFSLLAGVASTSTTTGTLVVTGGAGVSGAVYLGGALDVASTANVTGNFSVNTNKFNVTAASGNTTVAGTLGVTGATTLAGLSATTGSFSSTLGVTGATTLSSTLGVSGATTLSSTLSVTGTSTFAVGSAAAPSITFAGDTNTGLYWISADVLGITTGGTQAATFDASGNATFVGSVTVGNDLEFAGSTSIIYSSLNTGYTGLSGGSSISAGANVLCYGGAHATTPNSGRLRIGSTEYLRWESSLLSASWPLIVTPGTATGQTANISANDLVIDHDAAGGMSMLSPNTGTSYLMFGDTDDSFIGGIRYQHSTDTLSLFANNAYPMSLTDTLVSLASGTDLTLGSTTGPSSSLSVGFRGVPQLSKSANYTLVLEDAGKHVYHPSGGGAGDVFTIPANASVAFPVGTAVTFVNLDSNTVSIAITTDTLYMAGSGSTGSRTLAQFGIATALKISSTTWLISGTGLT